MTAGKDRHQLEPHMRLAAILLCVSISAHAEFKDGNDLLNDMDSAHTVNQAVALGYVMGVADVGIGYLHCAPANVKAGQLRDMVQNYLRNTPAERHLSADTTINKILKVTWPCPKRDRPA